MTDPLPTARRVGALGLLAVLFVGAFAGMDALTAPACPAPARTGAPAEGSHHRMFFL